MRKAVITASSIAVGLLLVIGLVSPSAVADRGWGGHRGGPMAGLGGPRAELMFQALDLSSEQRDVIEDIEASYRPQFEALRDSGRDSRRALLETTPDDPDYATVVAEASQAAGQNASQLVLLAAELRRELYAVLTPEQREKALQLRAEMRERFQERRERRRARHQSADEA